MCTIKVKVILLTVITYKTLDGIDGNINTLESTYGYRTQQKFCAEIVVNTIYPYVPTIR